MAIQVDLLKAQDEVNAVKEVTELEIRKVDQLESELWAVNFGNTRLGIEGGKASGIGEVQEK